MPQVYVPGGSYRLHSNPVDMARMRIANGFGLKGLMGMGDPRSIPARGPSVVLPLVRGRDGWFYLSDGKRAQDRGRGLRGLGITVTLDKTQPEDYGLNMAVPADYQTWETVVLPQLQAMQQAAAHPSAAAQQAAAQYAGTGLVIDPVTGAITGGHPITFVPGTMTPVVTGQPTTYQASAATGKPNQSVPPRDTSTPLPTGTGASGGNPIQNTYHFVGTDTAPQSNTGLLVLGLGLAALFLFRGK